MKQLLWALAFIMTATPAFAGTVNPMSPPQDSSYAIPQSQWINAAVLSANTPVSYPVPAGAKRVVFSSSGDFYSNFYGTAAIPGSDVVDGSASDFDPSVRDVRGVTAISLEAASSVVVVMSFYK